MIFKSGRMLSNCPCRRKLLVPIRAPWGRSVSWLNLAWLIKQSNGDSRLGNAPKVRSAGKVGITSFKLWTAKSIVWFSSSSSISFTKTPFPPILARLAWRFRSPSVTTFLISKMVVGRNFSNAAITNFVWAIASLLLRLPTITLLLIFLILHL